MFERDRSHVDEAAYRNRWRHYMRGLGHADQYRSDRDATAGDDVKLLATAPEPRPRRHAPSPMLVTPLPMVTLFRPVQSPNTQSPILLTLSGIVTSVRLVQL